MRAPISFPSRSPSRAIRSLFSAVSASSGRKRLGDDAGPGEQALVRVCHHEISNEKEADGAGDEKGDPAITRCVRKNFAAMERRRSSGVGLPHPVPDVLDRFDRLDQQGDLPTEVRDVDVDRAVDHVGVLPQTFERIASRERTRPEEERSAWRMRNSLEVRATGFPWLRTSWRATSIRSSR